MIHSFRHWGLKRLYERDDRSGVGANVLARVEEILSVLEGAETVEDIDLPGYRLHRLSGSFSGFMSVRVTGNWRITFRFERGMAYDVDLTDYH